ncbi:MAG TPA: gamma-glutamyl-gamma-aminobutyrate hydrolase family protein [Ktedonobacteraceae bacterium]|nr:gamma-glutamyl-gamma-aminobutyrate hydrolase family protein [Ktedonobacteraceae bacterium]
MRPIIGIPCHSGLREGTGRPIYCNNRTYSDAVESAGGIPILIPLLNDLEAVDALLARVDGLLLPGGIDVQPHLYDEDPHPLLGEVDPKIDDLELALARWALEKDLPILGICRGLQVLNVALGGTLYQDVNDQIDGTMRHVYPDLPRTQVIHNVAVEPESLLEQVTGKRSFWVNSIHHQAVKKPGKGVRISGRAEDGVVEAIESTLNHYVIAVQWHPEELFKTEEACANLFLGLVNAASAPVMPVVKSTPAPTPAPMVATVPSAPVVSDDPAIVAA